MPPRSIFWKPDRKSRDETAGCFPADLGAGGHHLASMPGMAGTGWPRKADRGGGRPVTPWRPAVRWWRWCGWWRPCFRHGWHGLIESVVSCGRLAHQADQIVMGWFTRDTEAEAMSGTLTADETIALHRLEAAVEAGVQATLTVLEAGKALAEIRTRQLFRDSAGSWDEYVSSRFKITRRRADQMVSFAGVQEAIEAVSTKTGTAVPVLSERASRPLVGLPSEVVAEVVAEAAESPEGVTAGSIRKAAAKRKKAKAKAARPRRFKVAGAVVMVTFNRKSNGSVLDALTAAMRQAEDELERQAEAA